MEKYLIEIQTKPIKFYVRFETRPNDDKDYVKKLKKRQKKNNGHCPSQLEKTPDTKCPCKHYRETDECLCGMYIKVPVYDSDYEGDEK